MHSAQKMETTNFKWYFDASLLIWNELDFILAIDNLQHTGGRGGGGSCSVQSGWFICK